MIGCHPKDVHVPSPIAAVMGGASSRGRSAPGADRDRSDPLDPGWSPIPGGADSSGSRTHSAEALLLPELRP